MHSFMQACMVLSILPYLFSNVQCMQMYTIYTNCECALLQHSLNKSSLAVAGILNGPITGCTQPFLWFFLSPSGVATSLRHFTCENANSMAPDKGIMTIYQVIHTFIYMLYDTVKVCCQCVFHCTWAQVILNACHAPLSSHPRLSKRKSNACGNSSAATHY